MSAPIYLDYAATCPCDPRVVKAMDGAWSAANTASSHPRGVAARDMAIECRRVVAHAIGARPREVIWTSGATEADNLAIKGYVEATEAPRVVTCETEHKAVLHSVETAAAWGASTHTLLVDARGALNIGEVEQVIGEGDLLSVMLVNNETGILHPIRELSELCHKVGAILHCDATQALGRVPIDVEALGVDMASFSAHKICGPKGIGCLYVREGLELTPQICGGRQERGMRAGTTPVPLCVGFASAAELAGTMLDREHARLGTLRARFLANLQRRGVMFHINGAGAAQVPAIISLTFADTDAERLLALVSREICVSTGSACNLDGPSHVMAAMLVPSTAAVLRISLGRWTKPADVDKAAEVIERSLRQARR